MADDPKSRSAPSRREVLIGLGAAPIAGVASPVEDPIQVLFRQWQEAQAEAERLQLRWGDLEAILLRTVGGPVVQFTTPKATTVVAWSHGEIDQALGGIDDAETIRAGLHAELDTRQARWETASAEIGLDDVDDQMEEAHERSEDLARELLATRAATLAGVIAKLTIMLRTGQSRANDLEFPWPQIRGVLADLQKQAGIRRSESVDQTRPIQATTR